MRLRAFIVCLFLLVPALQSQTVVVITGPSGSGKTTVSEHLRSLLNAQKNNTLQDVSWAYVSLDTCVTHVKNEEYLWGREGNRAIHGACLKKIYHELECGRNVLCDTIIEDDYAYDMYAKELRMLHMKHGVTVLTAYMHCSLSVLVDRLHERNKKAKCGSRSLSDLLQNFDTMFFSTQDDCGFGCITKGAVSIVIDTEKYMKKFDKNILKRYLANGTLFNAPISQNNEIILPAQKTFILPRFSFNIILDASKAPENIACALYQFVKAYEKIDTYDSKDLKKMNGFSWLKISNK